ncbi:Cyclin [Nakaseomyces glabratus]|nr:cyclin-like protein [Nakaseomyces glabratus]
MAYNYLQDPVLFNQGPQVVSHHTHSQSMNLLPSLSHPAHHRHNTYSQQQMMSMMPIQQNAIYQPVMPLDQTQMHIPKMIVQDQFLPPQPQPQPPQEQVNGGVSHVLDYDVEIMTQFVMKNAFFAFRTPVNENINNTTLFTKGIISVLNATRLPSVTIYLAIDYLFKYINKLADGPNTIGGNSINVIYQNTMIAFILANKFNDDKTFTNKSWSQATGMSIKIINDYERDWLKTFEWKLFDDKFILYPEFVAAYKLFEEETRRDQYELQQQQQQQQSPMLQPKPSSTNNYLPPSIGTSTYEFGYQTPLTMYSSPTNFFYQSMPSKNDYGNEVDPYQQNYIPPAMPLVSPLSDVGRVSARDEFADNSFDYDFYNFGTNQTNNTMNYKVNSKGNLQPSQAFFSNADGYHMNQPYYQQNSDITTLNMMLQHQQYNKPLYSSNLNQNCFPYSAVY